jgi:hypothetical protein
VRVDRSFGERYHSREYQKRKLNQEKNMYHQSFLVQQLKNSLVLAVAVIFTLTIVAVPAVQAIGDDGQATYPIEDVDAEPLPGDDTDLGFDSCDAALANLTDEQIEALTDEQYDQLCPPQSGDGVDDPCAAILDQLTDEQYDQLTDDQIDQLCGNLPADTVSEGSGTNPATNAGGTTSQPGTQSGQSSTGSSASSKVRVILTSQAACVDAASQSTLKQLKTYGLKRLQARNKALSAQGKKVVNGYAKSKSSSAFKSRLKAANNRLKKVANAAGKKSSSVGAIRVSAPPTHKKLLLAEIKSFKTEIKNDNAKLRASKTSRQAAEATCSALIGTRSAYLGQKIKAQKRIDGLYAQNTAYNISYQTAVKVNKITAKQAVVVPGDSPANVKTRLDQLQKSLSSITIQSVNSRVASGGKAGDLFASQFKPNYAAIKKAIKQDSQQVKAGLKAVKVTRAKS